MIINCEKYHQLKHQCVDATFIHEDIKYTYKYIDKVGIVDINIRIASLSMQIQIESGWK